MYIGVFDLFKVGIGPSSSHTMGPMVAAARFREDLLEQALQVARVETRLYGSLSATGRGHATDKACIWGLGGLTPETASQSETQRVLRESEDHQLAIAPGHVIEFRYGRDLLWDDRFLDEHPNGLSFEAFDEQGQSLLAQTYFSIGGGFVKRQDEIGGVDADDVAVPYCFDSGKELLKLCNQQGLSISQLMRANELALRSKEALIDGCQSLYDTMQSCIESGIDTPGILPGELGVKRRAPALHKSLTSGQRKNMISLGFSGMEWVNLFALAVNEENAAGGRMVTAPTNGAAGIVPAVLIWYMRFNPGVRESDVVDFLLAAAAVGSLCKKNASISGAEVGCQGEVGSACSMAAAGLCEVLGGTPEQVEYAAEIGLEHNLGLTCDPIGGLVQVPCIERNAIAAVKAINAANMALQSDGRHFVSLDDAITTLRETGKDMQEKYKETSRGGLAVNAMAVSQVEC